MSNRAGSARCVFDPIISGDSPAHLVLDEAEVVAFLDVRPVFAGHTLVVPRRHYPTVAELPPHLPAVLWEAGSRVAAAQRSALGAAGTFFGLNDVISQSVPHVHLHVVPRRAGDGLRGFFWPRTRYADDAEAAATAATLRHALAGPPPAGGPSGPAAAAAGTAAAASGTAGAGHPGDTRAGADGSGPGDEVLIRPARRPDAAALAAILAGGSLRGAEDAGNVAAYEAALDDIGAATTDRVLVADLDSEVVGMCQLIMFRHLQERGGLCAEIESMHVAEGWRSHGIGGRLLAAAVDEARAAGCYRIQLTSNKARLDAHRFYARHGFEASHEGFKLYLK